jgi:uncharacterized protein with HEPN domain
MKKDPKVFLNHILDSIGEIEKNITNLDEVEFSQNTTVQDAVIRRLEIIGEATKNLPKSFKDKHPEVEWRKVAGLRDIIVHEYFGLSLRLVWKITQKDIPELKRQISKSLGSLETPET